MGVSELGRLKQLEDENQRLKKLVADLSLDKHILQEVLAKKSKACPLAGVGTVAGSSLCREPTLGVQAGLIRTVDLQLSESGAGSERTANALKRAGRSPCALWLSAVDDFIAARGLAGWQTADLSVVSAGKPAGAHENEAEAGGADSRATSGG